MSTYVHLGRFGDIINTLPLLKRIAEEESKPRLVVAAKYASVLDGVSYVEPVIWHGEFEDLRGALDFVRGWDTRPTNLQVYGRDMPMTRHTGSFVLEQWHRAGRALEWGLPLVFDRRDQVRERALVKAYKGPLPLVLVSTAGFSSPFKMGERLLNTLRDELMGIADVVDLNQVQCERIYDLLGLYDAAACLVAIDSAHQHLAHGSAVPVVALSTDGPTPWHSSPRRKGHVFHAKYNTYPQREAELLACVLKCVGAPRRATNKAALLHVFPEAATSSDSTRRHTVALRSWNAMYSWSWSSLPYGAAPDRRDARAIGDRRDLPYMRDMIEHAICNSTSAEDIVVVSNSDVCMVPDMEQRIRSVVERHGAFFTHRWDFVGSVAHVTKPITGKWYPGSDVFGFTVAWWREHGHHYPDMIVGAEYVDCVLRQLIKTYAHVEAEIHCAVYHEKHDSAWTKDRRSPSNQHNSRLAQAWFAARGTDDLDPFAPAVAQQIRAQRQKTRTPA